MQKNVVLKRSSLRTRVAGFWKVMTTLFVALMLVVVPTAAYAEGLGDFIPSGPDFATLGAAAPIIVGIFAFALGFIGVLGIIAAVAAGIQFGIGAVGNNEHKTSRAVAQLRMAAISIGISLVGAVVMVIILNVLVAIAGVIS